MEGPSSRPGASPAAAPGALASAEALAALRAATSALSAALTVDQVAKAMFDRARSLLGASGASIVWLTHSGRLELLWAEGLGAECVAILKTLPASAKLPQNEVVRTGEPVFLESPADIAARYPELAPALRTLGHAAWFTVPLVVDGLPRGALSVVGPAPRRLEQAEQALLRAIADDFATAVARARRYDEERELRQAAERFADALRADALARAEVEEALRVEKARVEEHAELLEQVFQASTAGLALADEELRYVKVNPAYRALTPRPDLDPVGCPFAEVWPGIGSALVPALRGVLETGEPLHVDGWEHVHPDGRRDVLSFHVKRVRYRGRPALLGVKWDTTRLVHARNEAQAAAEAARQVVALREDLLRMISHDLRTPLHAVYTQAHLLRRAPDDAARVVERATSITRSCERMSAMIQDLVEMVLLESGQLRLAHVRLELPAYLADLVHGLRGALPTARIQLSAQEGVPVVEVDPPRLERIVVNLLSNALKYSPPASPVVVEVLAEAAGEVVIRVADGGIGIAPEDQGRIFGRFYRVTGSRQPEGLGLGLYIARLLTEAHGGRITLESAPGRGSVFSVHLPVAR